MIDTVKAAIDELGGYRRVSEIVGRVESTVRNWPALGRIPMTHYLDLTEEASARGIALDTKIFRGDDA